jgi:hypothetical protein
MKAPHHSGDEVGWSLLPGNLQDKLKAITLVYGWATKEQGIEP